jgi:hypothetical protein
MGSRIVELLSCFGLSGGGRVLSLLERLVGRAALRLDADLYALLVAGDDILVMVSQPQVPGENGRRDREEDEPTEDDA